MLAVFIYASCRRWPWNSQSKATIKTNTTRHAGTNRFTFMLNPFLLFAQITDRASRQQSKHNAERTATTKIAAPTRDAQRHSSRSAAVAMYRRKEGRERRRRGDRAATGGEHRQN